MKMKRTGRRSKRFCPELCRHAAAMRLIQGVAYGLLGYAEDEAFRSGTRKRRCTFC